MMEKQIEIIHKRKTWDLEQRSPEWYELRRLRLTGSNAQAISANGKGLETLVLNLVLEEIAAHQGRDLDKYDGPDMERGRELEDSARLTYEFERKAEVQEVGFCSWGDWIGCSPDGLVDHDGVLEIKCKNDAKHLALLTTGKIDTGEIWQCKFNAIVTNRDWTDYVSYNPNFKQALFVARIKPTDADRQKILTGLQHGQKMLQDLQKTETIKKELS